jgi:hypothetical protein
LWLSVSILNKSGSPNVSRYFCNREEIGENPRYIDVSVIGIHVRRLKNRAKPPGEAVLIFWLGELQFKGTQVERSVRGFMGLLGRV